MWLPAHPFTRFDASRECVQTVLESGEYRYDRDGVEPVETLVDVGFNLGAFTLWAVRCWWPDRIRKVYGYEPNGEALGLARENLRLVYPGMRWPADVELVEAAVTTGAAPRFSPCGPDGRDNWGGGHVLAASDTGGTPVAAVHPRDLPACSVLKVDCEGGEGDLYDGYPHLADVLVTLYEWHGQEQRARCVAACKRAGLRQVAARDGDGQGQHVWVHA
jgi:hypothetical protein